MHRLAAAASRIPGTAGRRPGKGRYLFPSLALALALVLAPALVLLPVQPAAACTLPALAEDADIRLVEGAPCEEVDSFTIRVPAGLRTVRIIADERMPDGWREPARLARRGIERAAAGLRRIGQGDSGEVVVLLSGLLPEVADDDDHHENEGVAVSDPGDPTCLIALYPASAGTAMVATTVHEFFHCVQYALAPDQMAQYAMDISGWWIEGTAEWFVDWSLPGNRSTEVDMANFDVGSLDEQLTGMNYEMVVFFLWYAEQYGAATLLEMMPHMPVGGGMAAQHRAAAALLPAEAWQAFAQAYLQGDIRYPDGRHAPVDPLVEDRRAWLDSDRQLFEARQFVLHRAALSFGCGRWEIATGEQRGLWAVTEGEGIWEPLPALLEVGDGEERVFVMAGTGIGDEGFRLLVDAVRVDDGACRCGMPEVATTAEAQCLIGAWTLAAGGGHAALDRRLREVQSGSGTWTGYESEASASGEGGSVLAIDGDGRYRYGGSTVERTERAAREERGREVVYASRITGTSSAAGLWAVRDGLLDLCATTEEHEAFAEIQLPNEIVRVRLPGYMPDHPVSGAYDYRCGGTALTIRHAVPGLPATEWVYRRVE